MNGHDDMTNREDQLGALLRLKRTETPGTAYFDAFVDEFHRYQRSEVLEARKSWTVRWSRAASELIEDVFVTQARLVRVSAAACGVALLALVIGAGTLDFTNSNASTFATTTGSEKTFAESDALYADPLTQQTELTMAHLTSFDRDFEDSKYVTGEVAVAYDTVLAF